MLSPAYVDREVQVGDLRLHYQEWGDPSAPPVVLLHGFGVSSHMFDEFGSIVGACYHLFGLDQRGHGDSDWSSEGDYSRDAFVRDLDGFRQAVGLQRFILIGHSMGGLTAAVYAGRYPERVERLVLVDVGPEAIGEGVDNVVRFTRGPDNLEFEQYVEMAHRFNPRRSVENIRERMRHRLRPTGDGKWTWKFDRRFRDAGSGLRVGSAMSAGETWALFRHIVVPTLLVRGADSDVLAQDVAERVVAEMPAARLVVIPGAGHSVPGDNPVEFTNAVLDFLSARVPAVVASEEPAAPVPSGPQPTEVAPAPPDRRDESSAAEREPIAGLPADDAPVPRPDAPGTGGEVPGTGALAPRATHRPARRRAGRQRRAPGLLVIVGGLAIAAVAAIVGVRSLSQRKSTGSRTATRAGRSRGPGQREDADARERALAVFDELSALGRDRLERARGVELRAVDSARSLGGARRQPVALGARRAEKSKNRGALRIVGRGARAAGRLALGQSKGKGAKGSRPRPR